MSTIFSFLFIHHQIILNFDKLKIQKKSILPFVSIDNVYKKVYNINRNTNKPHRLSIMPQITDSLAP